MEEKEDEDVKREEATKEKLKDEEENLQKEDEDVKREEVGEEKEDVQKEEVE